MNGLSTRIMEHAEALPAATPLCPASLSLLGDPVFVDHSISHLVRARKLLRVCHGVYMCPVMTRFGSCAPSISRAIAELSALWGETIVPCGGAAANYLGLTKQNPIREVYLTSGPSRQLQFSGLAVELRHTPPWQLMAPDCKAGVVIRALAWLGPYEVDRALDMVLPELSADEQNELTSARFRLPMWMAKPIDARIVHAKL